MPVVAARCALTAAFVRVMVTDKFLGNLDMSTKKVPNSTPHTSAWIAQTYVSFIISISATIIGVFYMPGDNWLKGYMGMGLLFSVASTASLSKTIRDVEEAKTMMSRIDEAKLERLLAEYDPFKQ